MAKSRSHQRPQPDRCLSPAPTKGFIIKRSEAGAFGDAEPVGEGVFELREHLGAGYRVYYGQHGQTVVILLCGRTKKTQPADIKTAREYWTDWKRRQ